LNPRRLSGAAVLAGLAALAATSLARPPEHRLTPSPDEGAGLCWEFHEVSPEGVVSAEPSTSVTLRNGQGKLFLKKPCGWRP